MKKIITASFLAVLAFTMLLPVAGSVNAALVNQPIARQGMPFPPGSGGGGHVMLRQGMPFPPGSGGGGHVMLRQGMPFPPGSGGGGH